METLLWTFCDNYFYNSLWMPSSPVFEMSIRDGTVHISVLWYIKMLILYWYQLSQYYIHIYTGFSAWCSILNDYCVSQLSALLLSDFREQRKCMFIAKTCQSQLIHTIMYHTISLYLLVYTKNPVFIDMFKSCIVPFV